MPTKDELREHFRALRKAVSAEGRERATAAIIRRLAAVLEPTGTVALYAPHGSELDLAGLVELAPEGTRFVWPRVVGERLEFQLSPFDKLIQGYRGLREPPPGAPVVEDIDLVLVPGLGFDDAGRRLGQGGGFYDRAIRAFRQAAKTPLCVGVGFEVQRVRELPEDGGDERVDMVVTEAGAFECRTR